MASLFHTAEHSQHMTVTTKQMSRSGAKKNPEARGSGVQGQQTEVNALQQHEVKRQL